MRVDLTHERTQAAIKKQGPVGSGDPNRRNRVVILTGWRSSQACLQPDRGHVEHLPLQGSEESLIAPVAGMATQADRFLMKASLQCRRRIDGRPDVVVETIEVVPFVKPAEEDHPLIVLPVWIEVRKVILIELRDRRTEGDEPDHWQSLPIDGPRMSELVEGDHGSLAVRQNYQLTNPFLFDEVIHHRVKARSHRIVAAFGLASTAQETPPRLGHV